MSLQCQASSQVSRQGLYPLGTPIMSEAATQVITTCRITKEIRIYKDLWELLVNDIRK